METVQDAEMVHADTVRQGTGEIAARARREQMAEALCRMIALCHPRDACTIMAAALDDLARGMPALFEREAEIREQALIWSRCAHAYELETYLVAICRELERQPLGLRARKRLIVALWEQMPEADRRAFVSRVDPRGEFVRGAA